MVDASLSKQNDADTYVFFRNRMTIPIYDQHNTIIGFWARVLTKDAKPKYLNSADSILYNKSKVLYGIDNIKNNISAYNYIIVVEWYMDVISLRQAWFPTAVATCWTSLTYDHIKLLKKFSVNIIFWFDNDQAWREATERALHIAFSYDVYPQIIIAPKDCKDVDDIIINEENPKKIIDALLSNTQDAFNYIARVSFSNASLPQEKKYWLEKCFSFIKSIPSITLQQEYVDILADIWWYNSFNLMKQYKYFAKGENSQTFANTDKNLQKRRSINAGLLLISLIDSSVINTFALDDIHPIWSIKELFAIISYYDTDAFQNNQADNSNQQNLDLRWEKELAKFGTKEDQVKFILKTVQHTINDNAKYILYKSDINQNVKSKILSLLQKLKTDK